MMKSISLQTKEIFQSKEVFEQKVLNVKTDKDRKDVIGILADTLVRDVLKEHVNFLYIKHFSDFSLKQITNILFKEMTNEWIDYAVNELNYSKDNALDELRVENRIKLLKSLASEYYNSFKKNIFEEIADTFIELLAKNAELDKKSILINAVINSELIPQRSVLNINSWNQLSEFVKQAIKIRNIKGGKLEDYDTMLKKVKKSIIDSLAEMKV